MRGIEDRRICTAIEHQLEALNILNRQLFILTVGPGYKFLPNECEDTIVQFEKVKFIEEYFFLFSDGYENTKNCRVNIETAGDD